MRARTQWALEHGNASLGSMARYMRHTHPSRASARPPHGSLYDPAAICNLKKKRDIFLTHFSSFKCEDLTPNVMHVVKSTNLREESGKGFVVVFTEVDSTCPVVAPLDHGARCQAVRAANHMVLH